MKNIHLYGFADEASLQIDEQIAAMRRNGLSGLEIRNVDGNVSAVDLTPAEAREIRRKLDDAGLITWSLGSPIGKIEIDDDFDAHMERFTRALEVANILRTANMRMFSFYTPKGEAPEKYRNQVHDRLARLLARAEGSGVTLCHENEKGIYGDMAARCLDLFETFPALAGIFDPANFVQCGQDTREAWQMLKPYIRYMHIKDALPSGAVVPSGKGAGNVAEIVAAFIAMGGRDFSIEPHLTQFEGLGKLERDACLEKIGHAYVYESKNAAFDAACGAFKDVLARVDI